MTGQDQWKEKEKGTNFNEAEGEDTNAKIEHRKIIELRRNRKTIQRERGERRNSDQNTTQ